MNNLIIQSMKAAAVLALSSGVAYATNGLYLNGYGARSAAMGGVGIGATVDAVTATAVNPAAMAFLENRVDMGILLLNPQRGATCCNAPNGTTSNENFFLIPNVGYTSKLNDKITLGVGMVGKGGGRTSYDRNFFTPGKDPLGINMEVGEITGTLSYLIDKKQSVGVGLVIAAARFSAQGLDAFTTFSAHPDKVTDNGHDYSFGYGLRLGWQGKFQDDKLMLGAAYTSKRYMSKFDEYKGLFAEEGGFDLPSDIGLGISYKVADSLTVSFDWQKVLYTDSASVSNPSLPITGFPNGNLGNADGPGFGWKDQNIYKLGLQYIYDPEITLLAGINYGESPIPDEDGGGELEFNVLAPATTELHLAVGGIYKLNKEFEITGTFWHAFRNKQEQFIPIGTQLPFEDQVVAIEMRQWAWEIGLAYRY